MDYIKSSAKTAFNLPDPSLDACPMDIGEEVVVAKKALKFNEGNVLSSASLSGADIRDMTTRQGKESFSIETIISQVEAVHPVGRHPANFRPFLMQVEGHVIPLAMMAHPENFGSAYGGGVREKEGIDSRAALKKIQTAGFRTLIVLEEDKVEEVKKRWETSAKAVGGDGYQMHLFHMEDYTPPSMEMIRSILRVIRESAEKELPVAVYCGAGFGRSGIVGAAVALEQLIREATINGGLDSSGSEKTVPILDIKGNNLFTTPFVAAAVQVVREKDPENGYNLLSKNANASKVGPTVEVESQFLILEQLEQELRSQYQ